MSHIASSLINIGKYLKSFVITEKTELKEIKVLNDGTEMNDLKKNKDIKLEIEEYDEKISKLMRVYDKNKK